MSERDPHLMSIGRFSDATRLSVKALRLYDEMGLLVPEHVDPSSGYRYYGPSQTALAEAIRLLRSVDMPLEEIRQILMAAPRTRDEIMARHLERLQMRLASQEKKLSAFAALAQGRERLMPYEVTKKEIAPTRVASVEAEVDLSSVGAAIGDGFGAIMGVLAPAGAAPAGAPFVIYHDVIDEATSGKIEMCIPIAGEVPAVGRVRVKELPGGPAASTIHRGAYDEIPPAYHAVSEWMSVNGFEPAVPPCEVYLNDPTQVPVGEQLTEVLWGIREVVGTTPGDRFAAPLIHRFCPRGGALCAYAYWTLSGRSRLIRPHPRRQTRSWPHRSTTPASNTTPVASASSPLATARSHTA